MPELPEVETIKLSLEKKILGLRIKDIQILNAKSFLGEVEQVKGAKVADVWRRAKVLGINVIPPSMQSNLCNVEGSKSREQDSSTSVGMTLLFHLKMSGQVIFIGNRHEAVGTKQSLRLDGLSKHNSEDAVTNASSLSPAAFRFVGGHPTKDMLGDLPNKHTRVIFEFESQESRLKSLGKDKNSELQTLATCHLYFNDQRKFGWIKLVKTEDLKAQNYGYKNEIGPEPLEKEFTWELFKSLILNHPSQPVKVAILDPSVVAGVGNIYACEACFAAKIDPRLKVRELSNEQIKKLHKAIVSSLQAGIKYGGSTKTHFVDSDGKKGLFLDYANVYNRSGKLCKICGTKIEKIKLGGRGTFFCPVCQV